MKIIKFKITEDLNDFDVFKNNNTLNVKLFFDNRTDIISKEFEGKIHHWNYSQVSGWGYVYFYEISEVFGMSEFEKKSYYKKKEQQTIQEKRDKLEFTKIDLEDIEDFD